MQADEEFRSQLRDELQRRSAPPVGTLAADALSTGRRMRRRRQTLRAVSGTAAVAAVAVGSVTLSGAFGSNAPASAGGAPGGTPKPVASSPGRPVPTPHPTSSSVPGGQVPSRTGDQTTIPPTWTVPPAATVTDPAWVTPRAIIAEMQKLLPAGTSTSAYSGNYAYAGGDPRELWAVDGQMNVATAKGPAEIDVMLHKLSGTQDDPCSSEASCTYEITPDGNRIVLARDWDPMGKGLKGAYVWVIRKDGMSVQVSVRDQSLWNDDQLFALASNGAFGSLKMDKTFVDNAEATIKGTFMNPPA